MRDLAKEPYFRAVDHDDVPDTLIVNRSYDFTYGAALSGAGTLTKQGAGKLILTNNNTYFSGTTTISAGTLQLGHGLSTGALTSDNVEDRSDDATSGENDLVKAHFAFGSLFSSLDEGKVIVQRDNDKIKLWKASSKGTDTELVFISNKIEYDLSTPVGRTAFAADLLDKGLYIEGYNASTALKDSGLTLIYEDGAATSQEVCVDPVKITVFDLETTSMAFNHDRTGHAVDAVNIRDNGAAGTEINGSEWIVDGTDAGTDPDTCKSALYVKDTRATIEASFSVASFVTSAKMRAIGTREPIPISFIRRRSCQTNSPLAGIWIACCREAHRAYL